MLTCLRRKTNLKTGGTSMKLFIAEKPSLAQAIAAGIVSGKNLMAISVSTAGKK